MNEYGFIYDAILKDKIVSSQTLPILALAACLFVKNYHCDRTGLVLGTLEIAINTSNNNTKTKNILLYQLDNLMPSVINCYFSINEDKINLQPVKKKFLWFF